MGLKILRKSAKTKKMFENDHRISHENENRPKKTFMPKHLFALGVEKSPKTV